MTNIEWALQYGPTFRVALDEGQLSLRGNLGQIGAVVPLVKGHGFLEAIDYLCLCIKTGTEYEQRNKD